MGTFKPPHRPMFCLTSRLFSERNSLIPSVQCLVQKQKSTKKNARAALPRRILSFFFFAIHRKFGTGIKAKATPTVSVFICGAAKNEQIRLCLPHNGCFGNLMTNRPKTDTIFFLNCISRAAITNPTQTRSLFVAQRQFRKLARSNSHSL